MSTRIQENRKDKLAIFPFYFYALFIQLTMPLGGAACPRPVQYLVRRLCCSNLRVGAVLILVWMTVLHHKDKKNDGTYQRN